MIQSMTGFGKAEGIVGNKKFNIEIRSVNSKQFDLTVRMPSLYKEKEMGLRNKLSKALLRGKIDLAIYFDANGEDLKYAVNTAVIESYFKQLKPLAQQMSESTDDLFNSILKLPDVLTQERKELDETEWTGIEALINTAVERFNEFRQQEGAILQDDFQKRIENIRTHAIAVEPFGEARKTTIREKILTHLSEYQEAEQIDKNRFEQELIYYIEKLDITEEQVRLQNHLNYFLETLNQRSSQGKKLGFICQEIGREINTMGSKANQADIQKLVVQMKDELEKIKEQVLNAL